MVDNKIYIYFLILGSDTFIRLVTINIYILGVWNINILTCIDINDDEFTYFRNN